MELRNEAGRSPLEPQLEGAVGAGGPRRAARAAPQAPEGCPQARSGGLLQNGGPRRREGRGTTPRTHRTRNGSPVRRRRRPRSRRGGYGERSAARRPRSVQTPKSEDERHSAPKRKRRVFLCSGDQPAPGPEEGGGRVDRGDRVDPALEQRQRYVYRRQEEDQEYRCLHQGPGLNRAEAEGDPGRPPIADQHQKSRPSP